MKVYQRSNESRNTEAIKKTTRKYMLLPRERERERERERLIIVTGKITLLAEFFQDKRREKKLSQPTYVYKKKN